ncbi:MAG: hypothetical protein VKL39_05490 [Leptolyngbyaceae bacterium]|nr:hypothetical protein [Leptolyngbyaceae bacterium]
MMNKVFSTLLFVPVLCVGILPIEPMQAQTSRPSIETLRDELQTAICLNNWDEALSIIGPMIGSSEITQSYREELIRFRQRIQNWRTAQADLSGQPSCASIISAEQAEAAAEAAVRAEQLQAAEAARQEAIASQPQVQQNTRSTDAQCVELATTVNWVVEQSSSLLSQTNFTDASSIFGMLNQLSEVSRQASISLQGLQLSDRQLQTYQQQLIASYQAYIPAIRNLLNSANTGDMSGLQQQNADIQQAAARELEVMNQVNAYCGRNVINLEGPAFGGV